MTSTDFLPARHLNFNQGDGLIQDRLPLLRKGMLEGREDNLNNIVILVGLTEQTFVVNKCLAKLSSPLLEKSIKEASESNEAIKFPEIPPKQFLIMLECAIVGMTWTITNLQDTCRLIETSAHFGFHNFIEIICESVFREAETRENLFDDKEDLEIIVFRSLGFESLRHAALDYILKHASPIFQGNNFLRLSLEDLGEIFIQDSLKIESEVEVLNALIRWGINALKNKSQLASPENLRDVLAEPLHWIRFPNIDEREFRDFVIPLQVLSHQQIKVLKLWYKNGGSISAFNNHPRRYFNELDSQAGAMNPKTTKDFLHATKMDNYLTKFNMNIQVHNFRTEAHHLKIQTLELANENAELRRKVQRMESVFQKWEKIMEANRFCQKLEALKKYSKSSPKNLIGSHNNHNNYNLLQFLRDKIRNIGDVGEFLANIEEHEGIDVQLLESVNETVETRIVELQKVICSEFVEYLAWMTFQRETDSMVTKLLQNFSNTATLFACVIIFKNNTSKTLVNLQLHNPGFDVSKALPSNILPYSTHSYGQTSAACGTLGTLSYDIGATRMVVRHFFNDLGTDFGIALAPLTVDVNNETGFFAFMAEDWTNNTDKIKALCMAPTEIEKCIKLGNLCLHAELIGTGPKAILRVLLTECGPYC